MSTTLGILGTGLIGSSIGLRGRELGWSVTGYDIDKNAALRAKERGAIERIVAHNELYTASAIVVLASHLDGTVAELERLQRAPQPHAALILDIASVKGPVVRAAANIANFVASHPMAGSERSGPAAARADLFKDKPWLYVPPSQPEVAKRAEDFIAAMGGVAFAADATQHDATVALTSHVPQVFATLFAAQVHERLTLQPGDEFCGPVARELLRLSRSNVAMWREVLLANREHVADRLAELASDLSTLALELRSGDRQGVEAAFARAQNGEPTQ